MAIKKAIFSGNSLPAITSNSKYFVRYRMVSEDGSSKSQWSSIYELDGNTVQDFLGTVDPADTLSATVSADSAYVLLQWEPIGSSVNKSSVFDVYAQWTTSTIEPDPWLASSYEYVATISSNNFSIKIPPAKTYGSFIVQISTQDKVVPDTVPNVLSVGEVSSDLIYDAPDFDGGTI